MWTLTLGPSVFNSAAEAEAGEELSSFFSKDLPILVVKLAVQGVHTDPYQCQDPRHSVLPVTLNRE